MDESKIKAFAEKIYRIANFAPEDREQELTVMDKPGLKEIEQALAKFAKELTEEVERLFV